MIPCLSLVIGLNIGTYHIDRNAGFQEFNPGVYATCDGWVAGVYRNSVNRISVHAGKVFSIGPIESEVGLVTGYPKRVMPFVIPSVRFGHVRTALLLPFEKQKGGVTFSWEW